MAGISILDGFASRWWVLLLRGVLAILFGLVAFTMPGLTLLTLVLVYGFYAFADGLTAFWVGARSHAFWLMLFGVLGILVGAFAFLAPGVTAVVLLYVIAAWALVRGVFEILTAVELRKEIHGEWALIVSGAISILLGVALFANPAAGALTMVWVIGGFAVAFGVMMVVLAFRLRGLTHGADRLAHI